MTKPLYANVDNDGGFEFGMDYTTPVSWTFGRKLSRAYISMILLDPREQALGRLLPRFAAHRVRPAGASLTTAASVRR